LTVHSKILSITLLLLAIRYRAADTNLLLRGLRQNASLCSIPAGTYVVTRYFKLTNAAI